MSPLWPRLRRRRQARPGREASEQVGHVREAPSREEAGRDRRPVATRAVHDRGPPRIELTDAPAERGERYVDRALDRALAELALVANVHDLHLLQSVEALVELGAGET